ncbi:MAG: CHAT domain-containing protein, partial [Planctomycetes bacterium]|nr:CHAT domain-containing protein [Planctomycetota bacterium]
ADALCTRGRKDAAAAFVEAGKCRDTASLGAFLAGLNRDPAARAAVGAARARLAEGRPQQALDALDAVRVAEGDAIAPILVEEARAAALVALKRFQEASRASRRAAEGAERIDWLLMAAKSYFASGNALLLGSDLPSALEAWQHRLRVQETRGDAVGIASARGNLALLYNTMGEHRKAVELNREVLASARTLKHRPLEATTLANLATALHRTGDLEEARRAYGEAISLFREFGEEGRAETIEANLGVLLVDAGHYAAAIPVLERAVAAAEARGDARGTASALGNLAVACFDTGAYARALELNERTIALARANGDRGLVVRTMSNLANVHLRLDSREKALRCHQEVLAIAEEVGDRALAAKTYGNMAGVHYRNRDYVTARSHYERAAALAHGLGATPQEANALSGLAYTLQALGESKEAVDLYGRVLALKEETGDRAGFATTLHNLAAAQRDLGAYEAALATQERGLALAEDVGAPPDIVTQLMGMTVTLFRMERHLEAVACARRAVAMMGKITSGLDEVLGASARDRWLALYEAGTAAAGATGDMASACFFLESGRAQSLLEALGGRAELGQATLPDGLHEAEQEAERRERRAFALHARAVAGGERDGIRKASEELQTARDAHEEVVATIQREAKAAAALIYPEAEPLEGIQRRLGRDDALVLFALFPIDAVALVVRPDDARMVVLGRTADVEAACRACVPQDRSRAASGGAELRALVFDPLPLMGAKRLLLSTDGALTFVPFSFLAPEVEIAHVPSGTAHGRLQAGTSRGTRVLAFGDPAAPDAPLLPGSAAEAKAVGDRVLTGRDASESALRDALVPGHRWRSIHLACHAVVNPARPMLSSLMLAPDEANDGRLNVHEAFRLRVASDLVVLSACETARGTSYRTEGVLGFTRAFLFAGAPRVLASLWKVDDDATRALMVRFYELWKGDGIAPAAALRAAQDWTRSQEQWKHPHYWAAWQLWGLPD